MTTPSNTPFFNEKLKFRFPIIKNAVVALAILREIVTNAYQNHWTLSEEIFYRVISLNKDMADYGNEQDKKDYCGLLYWARSRIIEGTEAYGLFGTLEIDFRGQCRPLLNQIASFWPPSTPLPDEFDAGPGLNPNPAITPKI